jgi:hypothetical protein
MTTATTPTPVGFAAGAEGLGLAPQDVAELVELREAGDCSQVQRRMAKLVTARLAQVQTQLDGLLAEQAAAGGVAAATGVTPIAHSIPLTQDAARLQNAATILAAPPATGPCADDCACTRAASVTGGVYVLPTASGTTTPAVTPDGQPIVCTLDADGGNMAERLGEWQTILVRATGRETIDEGVAVTFDHDIARTAELARLLAAEYSCCSFASYHLIIDGRGVRMEIRTPPEARDALAAVFGAAAPTQPTPSP